ncbi:MAG: motif protein [Marmoricola sp.]|nr:motif protein [Marmoricola sp.]
MGKKSRQRTRTSTALAADPSDHTAVGPRQPCPCGSGRRYKACHGSDAGAPPVFVARPFEGLAGEADVVALREFVPAATAPLRLKEDDRAVLLGSLLPAAAPALVRDDGTIWLGLQVQHAYGDPSRDLAAVLLKALDAEPGSMVGLTEAPGEGPRLQDLVTDDALEVTVHDGFDYWVADLEDPDGSMAAALQQANDAAAPTQRLTSVDGAYWTSVGNREYLRWVLPHDEDRVLDAFARLHVTHAESLVDGDRLIGMFRAHGLVAPVWDLPLGTGAEALEEPVSKMVDALAEAMMTTAPLTSEQRAARAGLASRQLTIR